MRSNSGNPTLLRADEKIEETRNLRSCLVRTIDCHLMKGASLRKPCSRPGNVEGKNHSLEKRRRRDMSHFSGRAVARVKEKMKKGKFPENANISSRELT